MLNLKTLLAMKLHLPVLLRQALLSCIVGLSSYATAANVDYVVSGGEGVSSVIGSKGGAIYKQYGAITLSGYGSLRLINNEVSQMGGAMCATQPTGNSEYINGYLITYITQNSVTLSNIDNINISRNEVGRYGDAVYGEKKDGYGGAIYGNTTISNSGKVSLKNNRAAGEGGAIDGSFTITGTRDVSVASNRAGKYGGAVHGSLSVRLSDDISFTSNKAGKSGGAVSGSVSISDVKNLYFGSNSADDYGGAIYGAATISKCSESVVFTYNKAGKDGGAIRTTGTASFSGNGNVRFVSNEAKSRGGALYAADATFSDNGFVLIDGNSQDGDSAALHVTNKLTISGNEKVVLRDNGCSLLANNLVLGTSKSEDSYVEIYDGWKANTATFNMNANGAIVLSGNKSKGEISGFTSMAGGQMVWKDGATLTVGGSCFLGGEAQLEFETDNVTMLTVGKDLDFYTNGAAFFILESPVGSSVPVIVADSVRFNDSSVVVDSSAIWDKEVCVRQALISVNDGFVYAGDHYTYQAGLWYKDGKEMDDINSVLPCTGLEFANMQWMGNTLYYTEGEKKSSWSFTTKGLGTDLTWRGTYMDWYDVNKSVVFGNSNINIPENIRKAEEEYWCWVATGASMIQYWQDRYAPLYQGDNLVTARQDNRQYRGVHLYMMQNTDIVKKGDLEENVLKLWMLEQPVIGVFSKTISTGWASLGFTGAHIQKEELHGKKVEDLYSILQKWEKQSYSPVAITVSSMNYSSLELENHVMTLWEAECIGDEIVFRVTDSDGGRERLESWIAKWVNGEFLIVSNDDFRANSAYLMPNSLQGCEIPTKWEVTELSFLDTPAGLEDMLADYNTDKTLHWTGTATGGEWKYSSKKNGDEYHLASPEDGWKKACSGAGKTIYAHAYFTKDDSPYSFVFADTVNGSKVTNKTVTIESSLETANVLVSGTGYLFTGSGELKSSSMTVSGSLELDETVAIKNSNLSISGSVTVNNYATQSAALSDCVVDLAGGELWCGALELRKADSGSITIKGQGYGVEQANIQLVDSQLSGSGMLGYILNFGWRDNQTIKLSDVYGTSAESELNKQFWSYLGAANKELGSMDNYTFDFLIRGINIVGNASDIAGGNLFLGGSSLNITQNQSKAQLLTVGSSGPKGGTSSADITICEKSGATVVSDKSTLMTLAGETPYFSQATKIEAPLVLVGEDSRLMNDGNLGGVKQITVEYDATLSGSGVFGKTRVEEHGRLMVGNSPGAPVYESLNMASGSELIFCLDGDTPATATQNGWGSGTHSLLTVTEAGGLTVANGTVVQVGCSLDFLNGVTLAGEQTLTLIQLSEDADSALLAALQAGTQFKLANPDDTLEDLSSVGALVHSSSWAQGANHTLTLSFTISSCPEGALVWTDASGDAVWNSTSQNWKQLDGTAAVFSADKDVLITRGGSIDIAENLQIGEVVVSVRDNLTLAGSGSLGGDGSLVKEGLGELSLNSANTYTGGTTVKGGKLRVLHAEALGASGVNMMGGELEICVDGVDNRLVNSGESTLSIATGKAYSLASMIFNAGELTISGVLNADNMTLVENVDSTRIDVDGNNGKHGFVCDAGSKVWVVENQGVLHAENAIVRRDGKDHVLGSDGVARYGMTVRYGNYLSGSGHRAAVSDIVRVAALQGTNSTDIHLQGGTLEGDATVTGSLTLGGGTLELSSMLTVQGNLVFETGTQTTIDLSGWTDAGAGEVLVDFSDSNGYVGDSLVLSGIEGNWEVKLDSATGTLVLVPVQNNLRSKLNQNQKAVYDALKDITSKPNSGGVLGALGQMVTESRDEAAVKQALDSLGGHEYATMMSSQMEGNMGHMRRLRGAAGCGTPLGEYVNVGYCYPSNKEASVMMAPSPLIDSKRIRAGVAVFHEEGELDADSSGDGYDRSETGAQLTLEYLVTNDFTMGMGISQSRTRLVPSYGKRRHEDNTHFDLYGVYRNGRWSSTTALGVGMHQHDLGRTVSGMQTEAEADGFSVNFLQEVAYSVWQGEHQDVQVFGALESSFNKVDSFTETGAGNASLSVDSQDAWATDVTLGLRYNRLLPAVNAAAPGTFSVQTGVVASLGDVDDSSTMRFSGAPGYSFKQSAAERNRWGYSVGASVNVPVSTNVATFGSAEAVLRGDSYTVDAQIGLKVAF